MRAWPREASEALRRPREARLPWGHLSSETLVSPEAVFPRFDGIESWPGRNHLAPHPPVSSTLFVFFLRSQYVCRRSIQIALHSRLQTFNSKCAPPSFANVQFKVRSTVVCKRSVQSALHRRLFSNMLGANVLGLVLNKRSMLTLCTGHPLVSPDRSCLSTLRWQ